MLSQAQRSRRLTAASALIAALAVVALVALTVVSRQPRPTELVLPWYETASVGDGLGPESVSTWAVPPPVSFIHPSSGSYQDPTKWNGDHALNGGNKEWAEEDAALHAYNMENWRNKILETQLGRQKMQAAMMNIGSSSSSSGASSTAPATSTSSSSSRYPTVLTTTSLGGSSTPAVRDAAGAVKEFESWISKFEKTVQEHVSNKTKAGDGSLATMKKWFRRRVLRKLGDATERARERRLRRNQQQTTTTQISALKSWLKTKLRRLRRQRRADAALANPCGKKGCGPDNSGVYFANNRISGRARVYVYPIAPGDKKQEAKTRAAAGHKGKAKGKAKGKTATKTAKKGGVPVSLGAETEAVFDRAIARIDGLQAERRQAQEEAATDPGQSHDAQLLRKVMKSLKHDADPHPGLRRSYISRENAKNAERIRNIHRLMRDIHAIKQLKDRLQ